MVGSKNYEVNWRPGIIKKLIGKNVWQVLAGNKTPGPDKEKDSNSREWSYFAKRVIWSIKTHVQLFSLLLFTFVNKC